MPEDKKLENGAQNPMGLPPGYDGKAVVKNILRTVSAGALATLEANGAPFASLANVGVDYDGAPLLLISQLAGHTRHLQADGRCSLLLTQIGKGDPLAHPRITLVGRAEIVGRAAPIPRPQARARFLARHPKSALYADFPDFSFWRIAVDAFHLNGGFARAAQYGAREILIDPEICASFAAGEAEALRRLNADSETLRRIVAPDQSGKFFARGIDPEGFDFAVGAKVRRLVYEQTQPSLDDALAALAAGAVRDIAQTV